MKQRILIVLLAICAAPAALWARGTPVDGYAAIVNDRVITMGEVMIIVQSARLQLESTYEGEELEKKIDETYQVGLDALVERALILQEFGKQGEMLPDRFVDDNISSIINERFNNDRAAFLEALAEERMTLQDWREETKNRLIVTMLRRREVVDRVLITPNDVRSVYESQIDKYRVPDEIKLRMISLQKGATPAEQEAKRKEAADIRVKLLAGEDFAGVARKVSEGSKSTEGGDMGWVDPTTLRPELVKAVAGMSAGDISQVVEAGDEIFIIKIDAKKKSSVIPFSEVRDTIQEELRKTEEEQLYKAWIERLKNKYYVKIIKT